MKPTSIQLIALAAITSSASALTTVNFEDLSLTTPPATAYGPGGVFYNGSDEAGGFTSGGANFVNTYDSGFGSWDGWSYSTTTDTTTPGFGNQYSAYTGGAASGSTYGVAYYSAFTGNRPTINLGAGQSVPLSMTVTNTTYAALSMRDGDGYAKQFGGVSGDDPDWTLLTARGFDQFDQLTGTVEFYLADYRFADNAQDYIVDSWEVVDLTGLGSGVAYIDFEITSSDNDPMFGIKTPSYFAMDDFTAVPESSLFALFAGLGALALCVNRRR